MDLILLCMHCLGFCVVHKLYFCRILLAESQLGVCLSGWILIIHGSWYYQSWAGSENSLGFRRRGTGGWNQARKLEEGGGLFLSHFLSFFHLNKFRGKNVLNKSRNKLHGLTLCAIIVFNMIYEWLPHLCTRHIQLSVRSLSRTQIQPKTREVFQCLAKKGTYWWMGKHVKKKAEMEYPFEHGDVINYTLDGVSIYPVTTKIQASFLTQLTGRKETD